VLRCLFGALLFLMLMLGSSGAASESHSQRVPLSKNLGTLHHPITTISSQAQQYFDQGLRWVFAFNHEEAIRAFEEAARLDPTAAMAYWGIALALGPNINAAMDKDDERRAWNAVQNARQHRDRTSPQERAYIDAISQRYSGRRQPRGVLDKAYADAMRSIWHQFPDDPDAGVLFAESMMDLRPWDLWTEDGRPKPGTLEIVETLEAVLVRVPDHPGACHYYIHAVEASLTPERALDCARKLPTLMSGAGHLVHMPAHIYSRIGQYHEAVESNEQAIRVDQEYADGSAAHTDHADGYHTHNLHYLWASLMMEGQRERSLQVARQVTKSIDRGEVKKDKSMEFYLPMPVWSMIRFGQWDQLLRESAPPASLHLAHGIWRLGRGLALVTSGRLPEAEGEHVVLMGLTKRLGRNRTAEEKTQRVLLNIAERLLAGELAVRHKRYDEGIKLLTDAVKLEDGLPYTEPPYWPIPIRHYLGALFLAAGRPGEAEQVYRADLAKHPQNGWGYFGLLQSLRAQRKNSAVKTVEPQFKEAWTHADVALAASHF